MATAEKAPMPSIVPQPAAGCVHVSFDEVDAAVEFWRNEMARPEFQLARDATPADIRIFTAAISSIHDHIRLNLGTLRAWRKNLDRGLKVAESQAMQRLSDDIGSVSGRKEMLASELSYYYEVINRAEAWLAVYESVEKWLSAKQDLAINLITTMKLEASTDPV
jgi:hypothetical protein